MEPVTIEIEKIGAKPRGWYRDPERLALLKRVQSKELTAREVAEQWGVSAHAVRLAVQKYLPRVPGKGFGTHPPFTPETSRAANARQAAKPGTQDDITEQVERADRALRSKMMDHVPTMIQVLVQAAVSATVRPDIRVRAAEIYLLHALGRPPQNAAATRSAESESGMSWEDIVKLVRAPGTNEKEAGHAGEGTRGGGTGRPLPRGGRQRRGAGRARSDRPGVDAGHGVREPPGAVGRHE